MASLCCEGCELAIHATLLGVLEREKANEDGVVFAATRR